jgi:hypothetical protein
MNKQTVHRRRLPLTIIAMAGACSLNSAAKSEEAQSAVMTALSATTLSGYVDTSAIWKFGSDNTLVGRTYDGTAKQDGFNLNVVKLSLGKPIGEETWSAGYQVDLLFGPDASTYRSLVGGPLAGGSDFAIEQACLNLKVPLGNGLNFTFGLFDTPFCYERFDSWRNPNYSRSYGHSIMPVQHTGLVGAYRFSEWMTLAAGVANTCNSLINGRPYRANGPAAESEKTYVGALYLSAPKCLGCLEGANLTFVIGNGLNGINAPTASRITAYSVNGNVPTPLKGFSVGAAYDYVGTTQNGAVGPFYANASALYLMCQATEKLKFNNRVEYASATSGIWTGVLGAGRTKPPGGEKFLGETFTVDYQLWQNVLSRVEFRWDHDLTARRGVAAPFGGGAADGDKNAFSLALNLIYRF